MEENKDTMESEHAENTSTENKHDNRQQIVLPLGEYSNETFSEEWRILLNSLSNLANASLSERNTNKKLQEEMDAMKMEKDSLSQECQKFKKLVEEANQALQELLMVTGCTVKKSGLNDNIQEVKQLCIKELEQTKKLEECLKENDASLAELTLKNKKMVAKLQRKINKNNASITELTKRNKEREEQTAELEVKLKEKSDMLNDCTEEFRKIQTEKKSLEKDIVKKNTVLAELAHDNEELLEYSTKLENEFKEKCEILAVSFQKYKEALEQTAMLEEEIKKTEVSDTNPVLKNKKKVAQVAKLEIEIQKKDDLLAELAAENQLKLKEAEDNLVKYTEQISTLEMTTHGLLKENEFLSHENENLHNEISNLRFENQNLRRENNNLCNSVKENKSQGVQNVHQEISLSTKKLSKSQSKVADKEIEIFHLIDEEEFSKANNINLMEHMNFSTEHIKLLEDSDILILTTMNRNMTMSADTFMDVDTTTQHIEPALSSSTSESTHAMISTPATFDLNINNEVETEDVSSEFHCNTSLAEKERSEDKIENTTSELGSNNSNEAVISAPATFYLQIDNEVEIEDDSSEFHCNTSLAEKEKSEDKIETTTSEFGSNNSNEAVISTPATFYLQIDNEVETEDVSSEFHCNTSLAEKEKSEDKIENTTSELGSNNSNEIVGNGNNTFCHEDSSFHDANNNIGNGEENCPNKDPDMQCFVVLKKYEDDNYSGCSPNVEVNKKTCKQRKNNNSRNKKRKSYTQDKRVFKKVCSTSLTEEPSGEKVCLSDDEEKDPSYKP